MMERKTSYFLVLILLALVCGCSQKVTLVPVEGTVYVDEKPAANIMVRFLPDPEKETTGPVSTGVSDQDGHFQLTAADERPGAVVGTHIVILRDLNSEPVGGKGSKKSSEPARKLPPSRIPADYTEAKSKPMRETVSQGGAPIVFRLVSPATGPRSP